MPKCCPRLSVVCKKMDATSVSTRYYTQKDPLHAPVAHTATAHLPARTKCAVKLGSRVVTAFVPLDSKKLDANIERYRKHVAAQGCEMPPVPSIGGSANFPDAGPKYPDKVPSIVKDRLQKLIESKRRG